MRTENLAYNIDSYKRKSPQAFVADVSSLVLEASAKQDQRITPYFLRATPQGKVISPAYGDTDIAESFKLKTAIDYHEREATLKIKEIILTQEKPFVVVWISPPDENNGYKEGRLQVGFGSKQGFFNVVENYGICVKWSADECLSLGKRLMSLSKGGEINSASDLRATPICLPLPGGENPIDFVAQQIDLPKVWENIKSGEAKKLQEKAIADANRAMEKLFGRIQEASTKEERVAAGAAIMSEMHSSGWDTSSDACPGSFYSDSVSAYTSFGYQVGENGSASLVNSELGVFCRECPFCHRTINAKIYPGYRCSCGQVFTGACGGGGQSMASGTEETIEDNPVINLIGLLFSFIFNL